MTKGALQFNFRRLFWRSRLCCLKRNEAKGGHPHDAGGIEGADSHLYFPRYNSNEEIGLKPRIFIGIDLSPG